MDIDTQTQKMKAMIFRGSFLHYLDYYITA